MFTKASQILLFTDERQSILHFAAQFIVQTYESPSWMVFCFDQPKKKVTHIHRPTWRKIQFRIFGLLGESWTKICFWFFSPRSLGKMFEHLTSILFRWGWFNHQLVRCFFLGGRATKKLGWEAMGQVMASDKAVCHPGLVVFSLWWKGDLGPCFFNPGGWKSITDSKIRGPFLEKTFLESQVPNF